VEYALGGNEYVGYTEYRSEVKSSIERGESRKLGDVRGGCYSRSMMSATQRHAGCSLSSLLAVNWVN